ncbi:tail fiber domain-containing protein [Aureispira anguillae]|uniref:Tail fiber domain-containing protein n=1 Tax=Aureispira anguillae TaxID=2864201 RepID=A0A915YLU8_9BACT|nr:tail fiber domain-containing protein [Aureispira anguillae]BDS15292.1 tail fiber domain-containing protein [Aureispira anguillae]
MKSTSPVIGFLLMTLPLTSFAQNVGIGNTNPLEKLDVNGDLLIRGQDIYVSHDATANTNNDYISYDDAVPTTLGGGGIFHFHADDTRASTWQSPSASISARGAYFAGRVGIGTDNPLSLAHISSGTANDAVVRIEADTDDNNEDDNPRVELYQDAGSVGAMIGYYDGAHLSGNVFRIGTRYTNVDDWSTFTINTQTKHIGIGTNNPDQRLDINGGGIQLNGEFGIGFVGAIPYDGNVSGDRAKIYYDGDFIGTYYDFLVFEKTDANNADPDGGIVFTMKGSDNIRTSALTIRGNARVGLQTISNPAYALELPNSTAVGTGRARANAWATYSDGRLKDARKTIPYGLQTVLQLNPLIYQHHHSTTDKDGTIKIEEQSALDIGFIAQELKPLIPEAVHSPENEAQDLWAVDYTRLIPVLTKAIQEQQTTIKHLEQKCNHIQAQYQQLQEKLEQAPSN